MSFHNSFSLLVLVVLNYVTKNVTAESISLILIRQMNVTGKRHFSWICFDIKKILYIY